MWPGSTGSSHSAELGPPCFPGYFSSFSRTAGRSCVTSLPIRNVKIRVSCEHGSPFIMVAKDKVHALAPRFIEIYSARHRSINSSTPCNIRELASFNPTTLLHCSQKLNPIYSFEHRVPPRCRALCRFLKQQLSRHVAAYPDGIQGRTSDIRIRTSSSFINPGRKSSYCWPLQEIKIPW